MLPAQPSLSVAFRGDPLNCIPYAGGSAVYIPDFVSAVGIDHDEMVNLFAEPGLYIDRREKCALYRGKPLPRSKCYVSNTSSRDVVALYKFPGFQYASMLKYHHVSDPAAARFRPLFDVLANDITFNGGAHTFTQAIATRYFNGRDNIKWHSDKMVSIAEESIIFDVSLGATRTFLMKDKTTGSVETVVMASGSAIAMTTACNESHQHAVLPEANAGARSSVVFRNINVFMGRCDVETRAAARARRLASK